MSGPVGRRRPQQYAEGGRLCVLVILLIVFFVLVGIGHGPVAAVPVVLLTGMAAAEVSARLLGPVPCHACE